MQLYNMCSALYELPNVCIFVMILKLKAVFRAHDII